jgi:hypothetical protein
MRASLFAIGSFLALAAGCGDGVSRWSGEGCQPACVNVDEDHSEAACHDMNVDDPACATGGTPTCGTGAGLPRCAGEGEAQRPLCR